MRAASQAALTWLDAVTSAKRTPTETDRSLEMKWWHHFWPAPEALAVSGPSQFRIHPVWKSLQESLANANVKRATAVHV